MHINIIAAIAENRAIGYKNKLLYHLSNDMKRFKALTTGHTIIMGRKTYASLPKGALPNRRNVVLSKTVNDLPGCEVYSSLEDAINSCASDEDVFIIGGESIYRQALSIANGLYLTEIKDTPKEADAFFPDFENEWVLDSQECYSADEKHKYAYCFSNFKRKR